MVLSRHEGFSSATMLYCKDMRLSGEPLLGLLKIRGWYCKDTRVYITVYYCNDTRVSVAQICGIVKTPGCQ